MRAMHHGGSSTSPRRGEVDARSASGEGRSDSQSKLMEPLTPTRLRPLGYGARALSLLSAEALANADAGRGSADAVR
jgi:hypothetical protein